ncbi:hypothetical protein Tco_0540845 [Tanacetum coccineum]
MVGNTIDTVTSVLTQRELNSHYSLSNISAELRPEFPDRNATIKDSPAGKVGMYTHFVEFANFCVPLSKFLLCVLEYYHINFAQLSVIGAAKIDAFVCPLSIPWFNDTSVIKDPLPMDDDVNLPCVELLNENRTLIRKYPKIFLCVVGLSRSYVETDVRPTFLDSDDEEMGLLDFVKSLDPFKVKTDEQTLAESEVPLLEETEDMVISPSAQHISLVDHTIEDELKANMGKRKKKVAFAVESLPAKRARTEGVVISKSRSATAGKSPTAMQRLIKQNSQVGIDSGSAAEEFVSSSVTPTPEHDYEDESTHSDNVRTCPPSSRFVILSSSSADTDIFTSPQVVLPVSFVQDDVNLVTNEPADERHDSFVPGTEVGGSSVLENEAGFSSATICSIMLLLPGYWAALRNQSDAGFLDSFNINSAQHACMVSELRFQYEHEIMSRERFEKKFIDSSVVIQQKDAKIADLKSRLKKAESEAAGVVRKELNSRVTKLGVDCEGLLGKIVSEARMKEEFTSLQETVARLFEERAPELDARIAEVKRDMDTDLYPHMFTAIADEDGSLVTAFGIQQGLETGVKHGKAGRSLAQVEVYYPDVEYKYVAAVEEFDQVTVHVYSELGSSGRSGFVSTKILLFYAIDTLRGHSERRKVVVLSGAVASCSSQDNTLAIADYQISSLTLTDDAVPVTQPHDDLFDTTILDKHADP